MSERLKVTNRLLASIAALLVLALTTAGAADSLRPALDVDTPVPARIQAPELPPDEQLWRFFYLAHGRQLRRGYLLLPSGYRRGDAPPLPLVISPHGRGISALADCSSWGDLPSVGRFLVVCLQGQGRRLTLYSWGFASQIDDLARAPELAEQALPWVRVRSNRIYAVGGSMGGQETLLLVARFPRLLAGAIAFDAVTDFARQYRDFPRLRCDSACKHAYRGPLGQGLQQLARREVGGTPASDAAGYNRRSPLHYARRLAFSGVPIELWWSTSDLVVPYQSADQSGALFRRILELNPHAPVEAFVGAWIHSHEERATTRLPFALAQFGLTPRKYLDRPNRLQEHHFIPRRLIGIPHQPPSRPRAPAKPA